jgi:hypothetical protein
MSANSRPFTAITHSPAIGVATGSREPGTVGAGSLTRAKTTAARLRKCGEIWALRRESCRDLATRACAPRPAPAVPGRREPAGHARSRREQPTQTRSPGPGVRPGSPCQQATETRAFRTLRGRRTPLGPGPERRQAGRPDPRQGAERPGCCSRSCTSSHDVRLLTRRLHVRRIAGSHRLAMLNTQRPECVRNAPSEVFAGRPSPGNRAGGRSVSYPRSDLNRHWGPF